MIGKARQERLWNHLLELEKQTGMPLRKEPRTMFACPIGNFAPDRNKNGFGFYVIRPNGDVLYEDTTYHIYTLGDSGWWKRLSEDTQKQVYNWLESKIKEHLK